MSKSLKRLLSWMLVFLMLLSMMPTTVFATEEDPVSSTDVSNGTDEEIDALGVDSDSTGTITYNFSVYGDIANGTKFSASCECGVDHLIYEHFEEKYAELGWKILQPSNKSDPYSYVRTQTSGTQFRIGANQRHGIVLNIPVAGQYDMSFTVGTLYSDIEIYLYPEAMTVVPSSLDSDYLVYDGESDLTDNVKIVEALELAAGEYTFVLKNTGSAEKRVSLKAITLEPIEVEHTCEYTGVYTEPTFEADGYWTYTCSCGNSYTETIAGTKKTAVAKVGENYYTDLQEAIVAAAPGGTVELLSDVTVDKWIMFSQTLSIGNGNIITVDKIDGLTIDGNGYKLTVKSIESAGNGNRLFYDADNLNVQDLTIECVDDAAKQGGIGLTSGTISNVTFNGGVGVLPGTGNITITGCNFNTNGSAIYNEEERDNLVVTGNTFNTAAGQYAIYLRGNTTFTDNTVITGKVNVVSGSPVVSGNDFGTERFKVYNGATATISGNTINNLVFNDETAPAATFTGNTLSEDAQAALDAVTPDPIAQVGETTYTSVLDAMAAAIEVGASEVKLIADATEVVNIPDGLKVTLDLNGKTLNGSILAPNAELTVTNGSIKNTDSGVSALEINAGKLTLTEVNIDSARHAVRIDGAVEAVIDGGTYRSAIGEGTGTYHAVNISGAAVVTVKGGTFVGPSGTTADSGSALMLRNPAKVTIEGGSFSGGKNATLGNKNEDPGVLSVIGGTFDQDVTAYCSDGYAALPTLDGTFVVGEKPTATVNNLGEMTVPAGEYYIYTGSLTTGTEDMPLNFVMQFVADQDAEDMLTSPYASWYADFVITFEGIEGGSFDPSGCYLAGYYGSTDSWDGLWVKIPVEGVLTSIDEGTRYPVMMGVGMPQTYDYICSGVQAFSCAMYIPEEILEANPNLKVNLELSVVDSSNDAKALEALQTGNGIFKTSETTYTAEDFKEKVAQIGTNKYSTLTEAIEAAAEGDTIVLLTDLALSETVKIPAGKILTLDLNGKTITGTDNATGSFGLIENRGNLTITDSAEGGKITLIATNDRDWNAYSSVISNTVGGKLTVEAGTIEHLGGSDMAYGIDNLTNGKGTYAETVINGGTVKSPYRAIRQFLNGIEAQNILTVNGGTIEGANKSIWMQDPSKNANTGTLTVGKNANLVGDVYLFVTAGSTEWPVEVAIAETALAENSEILTGNVPSGYELVKTEGVYGVKSGVAKIGTEYYATLAEAVAAAEAGDTIVLLTDVTLSEGIVIAADDKITLDLAGHTIDGTEKVKIAIMSYGDLTVKDSSNAQTGVIKAGIGTAGNAVNICAGSFTLESGEIYSKNNAILVDEQAAVINIKGGKLTAEPTTKNSAAFYVSSTSETEINISGGEIVGYNGVLLWNNNVLNITGGSIDAKGSLGIQGNGSNDNTKINISGDAAISGYYSAIYHPQNGELNISGNATLTGWTGVVIKSGKVNISGGTISGTGAADTYRPVSSGFMDTGDGLYVEHYDNSTNSENYGTPVVSVTGGNFSSVNAKAVASYANSNNNVEPLTGFITGGVYNTPVAEEYCAEGYIPADNGDGTYGVIDDPTTIYISNLEELKAFRDDVNAGNTYSGMTVYLAADIDLNGESWTPISDPMSDSWVGFQGTFDGQNYTISNLKIDNSAAWGQGLFGYLKSSKAVIKNVTVHNADVTAEDTSGVIAGYAYKGTFENCHVTGDVNVTGAQHMGGIVGNGYYANFTNCSVIASEGSFIKATTASFAGGIVGYHGEGKLKIVDCTVKNLTISGYGAVGGITGIAQYNNIITGCTVENVDLYKNRVDGYPSIGLACGTWTAKSNGADYTTVITDNTFKDVSINGTAIADLSLIYGSNYSDYDLEIKLVENAVNTTENINTENFKVLVAKVISGETVTYYATLADAIAAAQTGDVITLINDIELTETVVVPAGKSITLDGNGKTVTLSDSFANTNTWAAAIVLGSTGAGDDVDGKNVINIQNVTFDGITGSSVIRAEGVTLNMDGCTVVNCNMTTGNGGLLRLESTNATIKNSSFNNNTVTNSFGVITHNYNASSSESALVIENCQFTENSVAGAGVVYYNAGSTCTVNSTTFEKNVVNTSGNGATLYLGFNNNVTVTGNLFKENEVTGNSSTGRLAGAIFVGAYGAESYSYSIYDNAFVGNTATNKAGASAAKSVAFSDYDAGADLSNNYWDGSKPVAGEELTIEKNRYEVSVNSYYTAYELANDGTGAVTSEPVAINYVAQIGTTKYETLAEAVAAIATDGSDTTIKLLTDIELTESIEFNYGTGKVIFTADAPVTVKQTSVGLDLAFTISNAANIVIEENVTFEIYDNASGLYIYYGPSLTLNGTVTGGQNWGCAYLFNGEHLISETGELSVGRVQIGYADVTAQGKVDTNYLLVEGSAFTADGAAVDANVIYDNNNGGQRWGASQFAIKNGAVVNTSKLTLSYADSVLTIDGSSALNADTIVGAGKIVIDATGLNAGASPITGNASGFTGILEVVGNDDLYAEIDENGSIVLVEKISGEIAYRAYINDSASREAVQVDLSNINAKTSLVVKLLDADGNVLTETTLNKGGVKADGYTCNIVLSGTPSGSWTTNILADLTIANAPASIELWIDGVLMDTFENALGKGTGVDEYGKYLALDCVYKAASIGDTYYMTLAEAVTAAQPGETIELLADVIVNTSLVIGKAVTIDGNGNSIIANENATWYTQSGIVKQYKTHLLKVNSNDVTIKDIVLDCNDLAAGVNLYCAQNIVFDNVDIANTSKGFAALTVNGSTLTVKTKLSTGMNGVAIDISNGSGVTGDLGVTVEDGTVFELNNKTVKFASVAVNDMTGAVDPNGDPYFAAVDAAYYYTETQMESRTTAYSNGLKLLTDVELANDITIRGTLDLNGHNLTVADGKTLKVSSNLTVTGEGNITGDVVLTNAAATLTAGPDLDVTTTVADSRVVYENGVYSVEAIIYVAEVDGVKYETLAEALTAANDGDTITLIWNEGDAPIAMNGAVYGKSVTITGTATVDWSKGFLFVGRGGEGNGTVIFDGANLTSASNNASTGIHVSGREKNTNNKYDGTLVINNSTIELDYLINKGAMTLNNATLTVKNGFSIGGRPASETESGVDATATVDLTNGSKIVVNNHNGMGLGYEAIGVMNIDETSSFETTQSFKVTAKGTMNIAGTAAVAGTLTNDGSIVLTGKNATLTSSECGNVTTTVVDYEVVYENGTYKVNELPDVAKIGEVGYKSLQAAIDAAAEGDTVTVLTDITLAETVTVPAGKVITLDLNGKTVSGTDTTNKSFGLITNKGELTVVDNTGNGKITLTATQDTGYNRYSSVISNTVGGKLTVKSGTIEHLGGHTMAYAIDNLTNGKGTYAETVIDGGTVKSSYVGIRQFLNGEEAQNILTVNGGTVTGDNTSIFFQDPSNKCNSGKLFVGDNAALGNRVYVSGTAGTDWDVDFAVSKLALGSYGITTDEIPETAVIKEVNGFYTMAKAVAKVGDAKYLTLAEAVAAVAESGVIELLADFDGDFVIVRKQLTVMKNGFAINGEVLTTKGLGSYEDDDKLVVVKMDIPTADAGEKLAYIDINNDGYVDETLMTLQAALDAAAAGDTVKLRGNLTVNAVVIIPNNVTLDIEKNVLTVNAMIALNGGKLLGAYDSAKNDGVLDGGLLKVARENLVLNAEAATVNGIAILPIWDPTDGNQCYRFALVIVNTDPTKENRGLHIDKANDTIKFSFKNQSTAYAIDLMEDFGGTELGFSVVARIEWNEKDSEGNDIVEYHNFVYSDETIKKCTGNFQYFFSIANFSLLGVDLDSLKVTATVVTDSGATAYSDVWTIVNADIIEAGDETV